MTLSKWKYFSFYLQLLFIPILFEVVLGGGGRFFQIGPLTVRMYFFGLALMLALLHYAIKKQVNKNIIFLTGLFIITLLIGAVGGIINKAETDGIFEDIKPLSYFFIILFLPLVIKDMDDIHLVIKVIKRGCLILAVLYLVILALILAGVIKFASFYALLDSYNEAFFRGGAFFFYKGFLYLGVGFFFYVLSDKPFDKFLSILLIAALILTLTRGFILSAVLLYVIYLIFGSKKKIRSAIVLGLGVVVTIVALPFLMDAIGDKSSSDSQRFIQIHEVISSIDPVSIVFGHGFGIGTDSRPDHMEIAYLEIFHKQGIIGLIFWAIVCCNIVWLYFSISNKEYKKMALPFYYSSIFVMFQSFTNPFINNPIGLSIILITIVVFNKLVYLQRINSI